MTCVLFVRADKDRELGEAHAEIKALRLSERLREKAVEEVIFMSFESKSFFFIYFYCFEIE